MKAWWQRVRCALRGHPLGGTYTTVDGQHSEWCICGRPRAADFYRMPDGRTWMIGRGPEPWRTQ